MTPQLEQTIKNWDNHTQTYPTATQATLKTIIHEHKGRHPYYQWLKDHYNPIVYLRGHNTNIITLPPGIHHHPYTKLRSIKWLHHSQTKHAIDLALKTVIHTGDAHSPLDQQMKLLEADHVMYREHIDGIQTRIEQASPLDKIEAISQACILIRMLIYYSQRRTPLEIAHHKTVGYNVGFSWREDIDTILDRIPTATTTQIAKYVATIVDRIPPVNYSPHSNWMTHKHSFTNWTTPLIYNNTLMHIATENKRGSSLTGAMLYHALLSYHAATLAHIHPAEITSIRIYQPRYDKLHPFKVDELTYHLTEKSRSTNKTLPSLQESFNRIAETVSNIQSTAPQPPSQQEHSMEPYTQLMPHLSKNYKLQRWWTGYDLVWKTTLEDDRLDKPHKEKNVLCQWEDAKQDHWHDMLQQAIEAVETNEQTINNPQWRETTIQAALEDQKWRQEQQAQYREWLAEERQRQEYQKKYAAEQERKALWAQELLEKTPANGGVPNFMATRPSHRKSGLAIASAPDSYNGYGDNDDDDW